MIKSVSVKGQLVLPSKLRRKYGITAGCPVNIYDTGHGILIEPLKTGSSKKRDLLKRSKIDGGPALSFRSKQILTTKQVSKILEETE